MKLNNNEQREYTDMKNDITTMKDFYLDHNQIMSVTYPMVELFLHLQFYHNDFWWNYDDKRKNEYWRYIIIYNSNIDADTKMQKQYMGISWCLKG